MEKSYISFLTECGMCLSLYTHYTDWATVKWDSPVTTADRKTLSRAADSILIATQSRFCLWSLVKYLLITQILRSVGSYTALLSMWRQSHVTDITLILYDVIRMLMRCIACVKTTVNFKWWSLWRECRKACKNAGVSRRLNGSNIGQVKLCLWRAVKVC
jgi:hypothetical protein